MGTVRRISAFALVVTLPLIGIPLPAHAAGEEAPPLTLNGRPLSQLLNRAVTDEPLPLAGLLEQNDGQISGVAVDSEGQPLAEYTVHAMRVFAVGNSGDQATQRMGTTTTDAQGRFSFTGLQVSDYLVEVLSGDEVVANVSLTLAEGAMQASGITITSISDAPMSTGSKIAIGAGLAGAVLLVGFLIACAGLNQGGPCGY